MIERKVRFSSEHACHAGHFRSPHFRVLLISYIRGESVLTSRKSEGDLRRLLMRALKSSPLRILAKGAL